MIELKEIEWLKRTFQPQSEIVTKLPDAKIVPDFVFVVLKDGEEKKLYMALSGAWYHVAALIKREEV